MEHLLRLSAKDGTNDVEPIPVTLVTGFLGAGKTTLVNRLLHASPSNRQRIAIVVNEIGSISIDHKLMGKGNAKTPKAFVMSNGCMCCSTSGATGEAELERILSRLVSVAEVGASGPCCY